MNRVNNQLLKVMGILDEQAKLNPKDADIQLRVELFADCPDYAPLLNKLEQEYKVIDILQRPDNRGLGNPDHEMFQMEQPKNYDRYMSYFISLKPNFYQTYDNIYKEAHFGINNLDTQNRQLVKSTLEAIKRELNIQKDDTVIISGSSNFKRKEQAVKFLVEIKAIKSYRIKSYTDGNNDFEIIASRREIDKALIELILSKNTLLRLGKAQNDNPSGIKVKAQSKDTASQTAIKVDIQPLQPNSYHDKTGKLNVSAGVDVPIAVRGKVARKNRIKYDQCHLMSCLFKTVNTLNNGVTFSTFLGVKYDKNTKTHIRKIRNTVDEINKKVSDKTTAKKLIFIQGEKIFIDRSYLKNN